jgi:hypothetical protein
MVRIDVLTNADGDHVQLLIDGAASRQRLFTSRSLDPAHPAVWLDGQRMYGVDLHWNGVHQFSVPESEVTSPQQASGAPSTASS